jgi:mannonate dehydratase
MLKASRRDLVKSTLAALAGAGAASHPALATSKIGLRNGKGIKLAMALSPTRPSNLKLAKQGGVDFAIASANPWTSKVHRSEYVAALQKMQAEYEKYGLKVVGVESHPVAAEKIKLGLPGRDEEIENYKACIDALGKVGIDMLCYNWMAGIGWYRTKKDLPDRGGAVLTEFDYEIAQAEGLTEWGVIPEEKIWANIDYFLKQVIPVAEKAGVKMALHPDDSPISPLRGIGRILTSAKNYERVMAIAPSKMNGVTFCQANFVAMGEDIYSLAARWTEQRKIFFVHFRDIQGNARKFRETFHDNGPTDMVRMLKIYSDNGFDGPMRPDHAPTMEGEMNDTPGYAITGRLLAIWYMKGIMEALKLPHA